MSEENLDWEEKELDRGIDLVNAVFGAALGAYLGVVFTNQRMGLIDALWLSTTLVIVLCLLMAVRNLAHIVRGTHEGSWRATLWTVLMGALFFFNVRDNAFLNLSVLAAIGAGWVASFAIVLVPQVLRKIG